MTATETETVTLSDPTANLLSSRDADRALGDLGDALVTLSANWPLMRHLFAAIEGSATPLRSAAGGGGGRSKGTVTDPTGNAAEHASRARTDEDRAVWLCRQIAKHTAELEDLRRRYLIPADLAALRSINIAPADPCELHRLVGVHSTDRVMFTDFARSAKFPGKLDRKYRLCRWCQDFIIDTGRKPRQKELELHAQGRKVMRPVT